MNQSKAQDSRIWFKWYHAGAVSKSRAPIVVQAQQKGTMDLGQLANVLTEQARLYRNGQLVDIVNKLHGWTMESDSIINIILGTFLKDVLGFVPSTVADRLRNCLSTVKLTAISDIHRNSHMHQARGEPIVSQEWVDALLVNYVNRACFPLDLGLYTCDLQSAS